MLRWKSIKVVKYSRIATILSSTSIHGQESAMVLREAT